MKTLKEYQQDISEADRMRRLVNGPEYASLTLTLKRMHDEDVDKLIADEDADARSRIKFNKDLLDRIDMTIQLGDIASDAIKDNKFLESSPQDA